MRLQKGIHQMSRNYWINYPGQPTPPPEPDQARALNFLLGTDDQSERYRYLEQAIMVEIVNLGETLTEMFNGDHDLTDPYGQYLKTMEHGVPSALCHLLDFYDDEVVLTVAIQLLTNRGYRIT